MSEQKPPTQAALERACELWPPDNATEIALAIDAAVEAERAACEAVAQAAAEHFGKTQQGYRVDAVIYVRERIAARRRK